MILGHFPFKIKKGITFLAECHVVEVYCRGTSTGYLFIRKTYIMKKIISIGAVLFTLAALPAWAEITPAGNTTGVGTATSVQTQPQTTPAGNTTGTTGTPGSVPTQTVDTACLGTAADALTSSLSSAADTFSTSIKAAYQTRSAGWKAAWTLEKKPRAKAIVAADQKFRTDARTANKVLAQARKAAWDKIKADRKTCRGGSNVPMPEMRSE